MSSTLDDFLNIDTPENVIFGYEVAGIGSRFLAAAIDTILLIILQIIVYIPILVLFGSVFADDSADSAGARWLLAILLLIPFALLWGYYIFFELIWNGQSPGKRIAGLQVILTDGTPITLAESVIRNLIRFIDFLPFYYAAGVVTMFVDQQSRRLGDLAAGTLVVRAQKSISLEDLEGKPILNYTKRFTFDEEELTALPVKALTEDDIYLAEAFLRRHEELDNRDAIGFRIAQVLYQRMAMMTPEIKSWGGIKHVAMIIHAYYNQKHMI